MVRTIAEEAEAADQLSKIASPDRSALKSQQICQQVKAVDDEARTVHRMSFLEAELHRKEQALERTEQELKLSEKELALSGEGPPDINGETREDLVMRLQLSMLEHVREIADLRQALRTCRMSLYKSCFGTEVDTQALARLVNDGKDARHVKALGKPGMQGARTKSSCKPSEETHRRLQGTFLATAQRASVRELATHASRNWS